MEKREVYVVYSSDNVIDSIWDSAEIAYISAIRSGFGEKDWVVVPATLHSFPKPAEPEPKPEPERQTAKQRLLYAFHPDPRYKNDYERTVAALTIIGDALDRLDEKDKGES